MALQAPSPTTTSYQEILLRPAGHRILGHLQRNYSHIISWASSKLTKSSAGGFFSSLNDFAVIGQSILKSKLLPTSQTNRWLKPTSFVEAFDQGVGRPWEIYRRKIYGQSVDIYSKSGDCECAPNIFLEGIN